MAKTVLVFGASGVIGQGIVKVSLEKGYRVVGVFRSAGSAEKTRAHLGNPPEDKFIAVIGNLTSEESAAELQKVVLAKAGEITDVVASIGAWNVGGALLDLRAEDLDKLVGQDSLVPHFLAAKYFLPLLNKEGTSYTIINGGLGVYFPYLPNVGHLAIKNGTLNKFSTVLTNETKDAPTRVNEFVISLFVRQWDAVNNDPGDSEPKPPVNVSAVSNTTVGNALLGVIIHPNAKGQSFNVDGDHSLEQLTNTGKL